MTSKNSTSTAMAGRKDDTGKARLELIPPEALFGTALALGTGAAKYGERNWEEGMKWGRVFGAAMRHGWAWWGGSAPTSVSFAFGDLDDETKMSHLWHMGACVMMLIAYEARQTGEDDRHKGERT